VWVSTRNMPHHPHSAPRSHGMHHDVKTTTSDASRHPHGYDNICLDSCTIGMEDSWHSMMGYVTNCQGKSAECLMQCIFRACFCGLAHTQMMHMAHTQDGTHDKHKHHEAKGHAHEAKGHAHEAKSHAHEAKSHK